MQCSKYWSFLTHNYYTLQLKQTFISTVTFHRVCVRASLYAKFMYFSIAALKYALYMLNFCCCYFTCCRLTVCHIFFFNCFGIIMSKISIQTFQEVTQMETEKKRNKIPRFSHIFSSFFFVVDLFYVCFPFMFWNS